MNVSSISSISQLQTPSTPADVQNLLVMALANRSSRAMLTAIDNHLNAYFTPSRLTRLVSKIPKVGQGMKHRVLEQLIAHDPAIVKNIIELSGDLPHTTRRVLEMANEIGAFLPTPIQLVLDAPNRLIESVQTSPSQPEENGEQLVLRGIDGEVTVSRSLMIAKSGFARGATSGWFSEAQKKGNIRIDFCQHTVTDLQVVKEWVETGDIAGLLTMSMEELESLIRLMAFFDIEGFEAHLETVLIGRLNERHITRLIEIAQALKMTKLLTVCVTFLNLHVPGVRILHDGTGSLSMTLSLPVDIPEKYREAVQLVQKSCVSFAPRTARVKDKFGDDLKLIVQVSLGVLSIFGIALLGLASFEIAVIWSVVVGGAPKIADACLLGLRSIKRMLPSRQTFGDLTQGLSFDADDVLGMPVDWRTHLQTAVSRDVRSLDLSEWSALTDEDLRRMTAESGQLQELTISTELEGITSYGWESLRRWQQLKILRVKVNSYSGLDSLNISALQLKSLQRIEVTLGSDVQNQLRGSSSFLRNLPSDVDIHVLSAHQSLLFTGRLTKKHRVVQIAFSRRALQIAPCLSSMFDHTPHLEKLSLTRYMLSNTTTAALSRNCPNLKTLELWHCYLDQIVDHDMTTIIEGCRGLQNVALKQGSSVLSNVVLERLAELPDLQTCVLVGHGNMTSVGANALLNRKPPLKNLVAIGTGIGYPELQRALQLSDEETDKKIEAIFQLLEGTLERFKLEISALASSEMQANPPTTRQVYQLGWSLLTYHLTNLIVPLEWNNGALIMDYLFNVLWMAKLNKIQVPLSFLQVLSRWIDIGRLNGLQQVKQLGENILQELRMGIEEIVGQSLPNLDDLPPSLFPLQMRLVQRLKLSAVDHSNILSDEFAAYLDSGLLPHLRYEHVKGPLAKLHEGLQSVSERHRDPLRRLLDVGVMDPNALRGLSTQIFGDADLQLHLNRYLQEMLALADRHRWTDQERVAALLAAVFSDFTWLKKYMTDTRPKVTMTASSERVQPQFVYPREPLENKYDSGDCKES